jgi:lipopolysaccharide/colanic/teichoic acid biosynthesis glycosyltransferase
VIAVRNGLRPRPGLQDEQIPRPASPSESFYASYGKRVFDLVASAAGLALLLPLFAVVAALIRLDTPGPVFFRQLRVGRHGRPFRIFKFRSMVTAAETVGPAVTTRADGRITRMGGLLRRTKVDELPQLLNVLLGDMSLVGPRPEVPQFVAFYSESQRAVLLSMRPGMTDYAAIAFSDESSLLGGDGDPVEIYRTRIMPRKFALYEYYGQRITFANDLSLVLQTLSFMITRRPPAWAVHLASRDNPIP